LKEYKEIAWKKQVIFLSGKLPICPTLMSDKTIFISNCKAIGERIVGDVFHGEISFLDKPGFWKNLVYSTFFKFQQISFLNNLVSECSI